jgi:hypothetical protein
MRVSTAIAGALPFNRLPELPGAARSDKGPAGARWLAVARSFALKDSLQCG